MKFNDLEKLVETHLQDDLVETIEIICEEVEGQDLFDHLEHVAIIAVDLSKNYRLDSEKMYLASYLHDIAKLVDFNEYVEILNRFNIEVSASEINVQNTLHAKVSMVIAREIFKITDEELLLSIANHATLTAQPSEYDKVLFLAEKMTWPDEALLLLLDETIMQVLNVTCKNALEWIINDLKSKNKMVVPQVMESFQFFKSQMLF